MAPDWVIREWCQSVNNWAIINLLENMKYNPHTPEEQLSKVEDAIHMQIVEEIGILSGVEA